MFKLLFLSLFGLALSTTTIHPHHTHEPNENHNYRFIYDNQDHTLIMIASHACYQYYMTNAERHDVHTDAGLRSLELTVLTKVSSQTYKPTELENMTDRAQHACSKATSFFNINIYCDVNAC